MKNLLPIGVLVLAGTLPAADAFAQAAAGPEFRVSTSGVGPQDYPDVASSNSRFVVVWQGQGTTPGGPSTGIFARRFDASGIPIGEEQVDDDTSAVTSPRVAQGQTFFIVWEQISGAAGMDIFGRRYSQSAGPQGSPFRINSATTGEQSNPEIAADNSYGFVVVWDSPDGNGGGIYAQRYGTDLSPIGGEFRVNELTTGNQTHPTVAVGGDGGFVVAWEGPSLLDTTGLNVYMQRFDSAGVKLGPENRPHVDLAGDQFDPALGNDLGGGYVIAWTAPDGDSTGIYARRFQYGAPLGDEFLVNSSTTGSQSHPAIGVNDSSFAVAWQDTSIPGVGVFVRRYSYSGASQAPSAAFRVNQNLTNAQSRPAVGARRDGLGFVVAWKTEDQDVNGDVYARKLCLSGDADNNGSVTVADVFFLINYIFAGGQPPIGCSDANGSLTVDVADVFYLINYLFAAGPAPV